MKNNDVTVEVDQSVHVRDFWQTDYDTQTGTWEITYMVTLDRPDDLRIPRECRLMRNKK